MIHDNPIDLTNIKFNGEIPDHRIIRCIGEGAFGRVWLAVNSLGAYRAVKTIERSKFQFSEGDFEIEWQGIKRYAEISLSQPRMVAIFHAGRAKDDSYFYYIMELGDDIAQGRNIHPAIYQPHTLEAHVFSLHKRIPIKECIDIGIHLSEALHQFHTNGLLHRDVKPANIIYAHGIPKLTDIGLVSRISESEDNQIGTDGFSPIEGSNSVAADIYSLGKTLYEAATGLDRKQFPNPPKSWKNSIERDAYAELNDVLTTACHPDIGFRYSSCIDMHNDLLALRNGRSLRKYAQQEKAIENFKIITKVGFAIFAVLIALILVLIQKAQFERNFTNLYASQTIEGYTSLGIDESLLTIHQSIIPALDNFKQINESNPDFEKSTAGRIFTSSVNDFTALEFLGIIGKKETNGDVIYVSDGSGEPISLTKCIFSPEEKLAILAGEDGWLGALSLPYRYAASENRETPLIRVIQKDIEDDVHALAVDSNLGYVYVSGQGSDVNVYDLETYALAGSIKKTSGDSLARPSEIKLSPDGRFIAVSYKDGSLAVYDPVTFQQISNTIKLEKSFQDIDAIKAFEWSHSGKFILAVGEFKQREGIDHTRYPYLIVRVGRNNNSTLDLGDPYLFKANQGGSARSIVRVGASDEFVVDNSDLNFYRINFDEHLFLNELSFSEALRVSSLKRSSYPSHHIKFHHHLNLLLVGQNDGSLDVFHGLDSIRIFADLPHPMSLADFDIAKNGRHIISVSRDGSFRLWDLAGQKRNSYFSSDALIPELGISINYRADGSVDLKHLDQLSVTSFTKIGPLKFPDGSIPIRKIRTSLDGKSLQINYTRKEVTYWGLLPTSRIQKGEAIHNPSEFSAIIQASPDTRIDFHTEPYLEFNLRNANPDEPVILTISNKEKKLRIEGHSKSSDFHYTLTPDKQHILVGQGGGKRQNINPREDHNPRILIYNARSLDKVSEFEDFQGRGDFTSISLSESGKSVLFTLLDSDSDYNVSALHSFNSKKGQIRKKLSEVSYRVGAFDGKILPDDSTYLTAGAFSNVTSVKLLENNKKLSEFFLPYIVDKIGFINDQSTAYFTSQYGGPSLWSFDVNSPLPLRFGSFAIGVSSFYIPDDARFIAGFNSNNNRTYVKSLGGNLSISDAIQFYQLMFYSFAKRIDQQPEYSMMELFDSLSKRYPDYFHASPVEVETFYEYFINSLTHHNANNGKSVKEFIDAALEL